MAISAGDKVPSVNFKMLTADGLTDVASDDYFAGKLQKHELSQEEVDAAVAKIDTPDAPAPAP